MQTVPTNQTPEFRNWLLGLLHDEHTKDLCVTFTKKDGTERTMRCTLASGRIPADKQPKTSVRLEEETNSTSSGSALRVFDEEKQEWRSFRWDSIKEVKVDL
jgi:hypothetical protein